MKHFFAIMIVSLLLVSCSNHPVDPVKYNQYPPIIPDYVGVTIPANIAPLNFYINDDIDAFDAIVTGAKSGMIHTNGTYADFDIKEWHSLLQQNKGDSLKVKVTVKKGGQWTEYQSFPIYISHDSLEEWGVTYRLIPPGYETYGGMGIYQRSLSTFDQTPIIENKVINSDCMNCHTPNQTNSQQFTFHIRGEHGATIVRSGEQTDILAPRNEDLGGSMVYPFWHPSGEYIAFSTNQTHQNFHQLSDRRVEVFDDKSDIIIYRPSTHEIILDSIIATTDHLENYPAFSPNGRSLYFCSSNSIDSIHKQYKDIKYNICRIGFDAKTGTFTQQVDTIVNARKNAKSANMPRISYDGRFLLYTLCDYGCFPIWHPEADLWMMNLETGENYSLSKANSPDADSFHNWSLNSRWIVFTSRRDDGLYTQLYICHIDKNGLPSKPFRLPQRNPKEYDIETLYSFNTPEFAKSPIDLNKSIYQGLKESGRVKTNLISPLSYHQ